MNAITDALKWILIEIHKVVQSYGWSIVIFTVLVKLALMPLDIKNRKGMRKMAKIQPELNRLQKKYANDKQKLQQKQAELMKKEHYSPLSGCLPLLIQMPILFAMFGAMRALANEQVVAQVFTFLSGGEPVYDGWLWVRNIWAPDSLFAAKAPDLNAIMQIPLDVWQRAFQNPDLTALLPAIQQVIPDFSYQLFLDNSKNLSDFIKTGILPALQQKAAYAAQTAPMPGWSASTCWSSTCRCSSSITATSSPCDGGPLPGARPSSPRRHRRRPPPGREGAAGQQAGMTGFMKYFFPLFSVFITLTSNAGFALYWVVSNLIATGLNVLITQHYDRQDRLAEASRIEGTVT